MGRAVYFALFDTTVEEVLDCLRGADFSVFKHLDDDMFNYPPPGQTRVLYGSVHNSILDRHSEYNIKWVYDPLVQALGNINPSVVVIANVSGKYPGDKEVRYIASVLLKRFRGYAFDEYSYVESTVYPYAWSLDEIESNTTVDGLLFFDYLGWYRRSQEEKGGGK